MSLMNPVRSWRLTPSSALFLDRDGVINRCVEAGFIHTKADFEFMPGVPAALKEAASLFGYIFVVTNQPAVQKGLMSENELDHLHDWMCGEIAKSGGRIDKVYYCTDLKNSRSFYRKPAVGMGLRAQKEFTGLRFADSFMVGDTRTDMAFGHRLGMHTVLIGRSSAALAPPCVVEACYEGLPDFIERIKTL